MEHPHKIYWDLEKEQFPKEVSSVLICNYCGGITYNPNILDTRCCSCGKKFIDTESVPQRLPKKG